MEANKSVPPRQSVLVGHVSSPWEAGMKGKESGPQSGLGTSNISSIWQLVRKAHPQTPRLKNQEYWGSTVCVYKPSKWFCCSLRFEDHYSIEYSQPSVIWAFFKCQAIQAFLQTNETRISGVEPGLHVFNTCGSDCIWGLSGDCRCLKLTFMDTFVSRKETSLHPHPQCYSRALTSCSYLEW